MVAIINPGPHRVRVEFVKIRSNRTSPPPFQEGEVFAMEPELNSLGKIVAGNIEKNEMSYYILMTDCCYGKWKILDKEAAPTRIKPDANSIWRALQDAAQR